MIMNRYIAALAAAACGLTAMAASQPITQFRLYGPVAYPQALVIDTTDVNGHAFAAESLLDAAMPLDAVKGDAATLWSGQELPAADDAACSVGLLGFTLSSTSYVKAELKFGQKPAHYQLFVDDVKVAGSQLSLEPGTHECVIKYLSQSDKTDSLSLTVETGPDAAAVTAGLSGEGHKYYTVERMMTSRLCYGTELSPNGDYMIVTTGQRAPKENKRWYRIVERKTGRIVSEGRRAEWMPVSNAYYYTREEDEGRELVTVDPATGAEHVIARHMPEGWFTIAPNEQFAIFTVRQEGPKEKNKDVFEVLNPEDRQPRWRDRSYLARYDFVTGVLTPLTFGHRNHWLCDISHDSQYLLIACNKDRFPSTSQERPTRPTSGTALYRLNLATMQADTIVSDDGFIHGGQFSPDGSQILVGGSPEAFGRIGCTLPADRTPSMYDYQAYVIDVATHQVRPLTRDFDPSVSRTEWSTYDGLIYMTCENRDSVSLYTLDAKTGRISMLPLPEENVKGFSLARTAPVMSWHGQSAVNSDRIYQTDLKKKQTACIDDLSARTLDGYQVADCHRWTFTNSVGDEVLCRYYVPVGYDESAGNAVGQYPMITYYYGGCSPTERSFESSYPWQIWAAQGYAVLVVQPSGAAGFGQEWASRHVNTAGVDPARDITEAVREFCRTHPYVNKDKVGCCGASYGGFMTQYLQTLPDCPFACAISHAGISDHTTYWGYGYWGYSYSEVSMANSYPWSETDLYVGNSPIYRVDKIHTPILFLHGTKDVNVPINNSIQMFTALKLLGRETAFVCIEGEDHGIVDYDKRIAWLKTSMAYFQKYLKDDASWWDELYPHKDL